jgi:Zn-dependent alcohol dehydrogenase
MDRSTYGDLEFRRPERGILAIATGEEGRPSTVTDAAAQGARRRLAGRVSLLLDKTLRGSIRGSADPGRDFPRLFELVARGELRLEGLTRN